MNARGSALELFIDSPKYESKRFGPTPYLDISAAHDNGSLVVNVVNRHRDQAIEVEFETQDKQFAGPVEAAEVNGPDIKAENDFGVTKVQMREQGARYHFGLSRNFQCFALIMQKNDLIGA